MKNILLLLLVAVFLAGCMHNYDLTLVNGMKITHVSKPKLNKQTGVYTFKDVKGRTNSISAARVVEIAPHSSSVKAGTPP
jgi:PBP1b-binding outer membrane lipoprotein LpoB